MSRQGDTDVNSVLLFKNPHSVPLQGTCPSPPYLNCSDMGVKLLAIHPLLWFFFLLSFVLCFFRTFVCLVAGLPAFEALSFFHQLGSFVEHQSVDVHCVQVSFLPRKIESGCWFLRDISFGPFNRSF